MAYFFTKLQSQPAKPGIEMDAREIHFLYLPKSKRSSTAVDFKQRSIILL